MHPLKQHLGDELIVSRYGAGIQLQRPDASTMPLNLSGIVSVRPTVKDVMSINMNTFFISSSSEMVHINTDVADSLNLSSIESSIGKTMLDVSPIANVGLLKTDQAVINDRQLQILDDTVIRNDGVAVSFLTIKMPWYHKNRVIGVFGCAIWLDARPVGESLTVIRKLGLLNDRAPIGVQLQDVYLTKREAEIAYHLVRGKSANQIGKMIYLSQRTVEDHIENMKSKMNVTSKAELIEKLISEAFG